MLLYINFIPIRQKHKEKTHRHTARAPDLRGSIIHSHSSDPDVGSHFTVDDRTRGHGHVTGQGVNREQRGLVAGEAVADVAELSWDEMWRHDINGLH